MSEQAVLDTFDALYRLACVERDAEGVVAVFAPDDDIVMWGSDELERASGPTELRALAESIAASTAALRFDWVERRVRVEGDVAWVNARGSFTVDRDDGTPQTSPYRVTGVFVLRDGHWRWHTHNGSEPNE